MIYGMIASVFSKMETTFSRSLRRYNPSSVPPSENNPQEKENNHLISGSLDPFHESIEINAQEKHKKKRNY